MNNRTRTQAQSVAQTDSGGTMISDPIEAIVATALTSSGIRYQHELFGHLDFYLPDYEIEIECKQFHSDRISEQMSRHKNVIAIQGKEAALASQH